MLVLVKRDVDGFVPDGVDGDDKPKTRKAAFFGRPPDGRIYDVPEGTKFADTDRVGKVSAAAEKDFHAAAAAGAADDGDDK